LIAVRELGRIVRESILVVGNPVAIPVRVSDSRRSIPVKVQKDRHRVGSADGTVVNSERDLIVPFQVPDELTHAGIDKPQNWFTGSGILGDGPKVSQGVAIGIMAFRPVKPQRLIEATRKMVAGHGHGRTVILLVPGAGLTGLDPIAGLRRKLAQIAEIRVARVVALPLALLVVPDH